MKCEYLFCGEEADFVALELYIYRGEFYDLVGLMVCKDHLPNSGNDPRFFWNQTRPHMTKMVGTDSPNFEWIAAFTPSELGSERPGSDSGVD